MDPILLRFKDKFIDEANGLLDRLEKDLLDLETKPADKELIESAFRAMHTIKGVSGMYGYEFICEFTHHMESIYQAIRENKISFNKEICEITFLSIDHIRKLLSDEKLSDATNLKKHNQLIDSINKIIQSPSLNNVTTIIPEIQAEEGTFEGTWHILLRTTETMFFRGISLISIFKELADLGKYQITKIDNLTNDCIDTWSIFLNSKASEQDIKEVFLFIEDECTIVNLSRSNILTDEMESEASEDPNEEEISILDYIEGSDKKKAKSKSEEKLPGQNAVVAAERAIKRISVDSTKLDQLMFLVSELITVNSQLTLSSRDAIFSSLRPYLEKVDTLAKQFRNNAIEIRLVPLSDTVLRFQRLIRDLSKQLNKKVDFNTQGTNTELDKNTIDQLAEPLMHIIRNCIDHGIESPEERLKSGKPEQGIITLSAFNSGNFVYISISDDGKGIDIEKVRQKGVDKGILKSTDKPDRKQIYDLIFMPGFSTAQSLTEVSGRGVGMDIVKKRINDLRGEVIIESETGVGTSFTLKLQQSLSIIDTLLFTVGDNFFTVPIAEIALCSQVTSEEIDQRRHTSTIPFDNHLIPFIDLRALFQESGKYEKNLKLIIIRNNERELALLSDRIVGEHQAVLKPLGKSLRDQIYITSASQMGNGQMAFMIDTNSLMKSHEMTT